MSRLEANISLLIITFFGSLQYIFLAYVPSSVSHFAFLSVTNFVGFGISLAFFYGELFRLDRHQILQSAILASELIVFNFLMLRGASEMSSTVTAAVLSSYFVFVAAFSAVITKKLPDAGTTAGVLVVLAGLFLMTDADAGGLMNAGVFYLLLADVVLAVYVMTIGSYASSSNPAILAMGQMFFGFIFSMFFWTWEVFFSDGSFVLPSDKFFWSSVIYISFFMRGLYTIIQIYAQRYVSPLNTSLIFSTEIIMTMLASPLMSRLFRTTPENITAMKVTGSVLILSGLLITEPTVRGFFTGIFKRLKNIVKGGFPKTSFSLNLRIMIISAAAYVLIDFPVLMTGILPIHAGIKNFLPFTLGLFFGFSGVIGCCIGCAVSFLSFGLGVSEILTECLQISVTGLGIWLGWYFFSGSENVSFTRARHYTVYMILTAVLSVMCFDLRVSAAYFFCGLLISLPIDILLGSTLGIIPVLPGGGMVKYDASFVIDSSSESLSNANEILETSGEASGAGMKQIFEIQSCIEELSIRILKALPDSKIKTAIRFGNAVSVNIKYKGSRYNPLLIGKRDGMLEIMSLKIIKHRALRASYSYRNAENLIHVVI